MRCPTSAAADNGFLGLNALPLRLPETTQWGGSMRPPQTGQFLPLTGGSDGDRLREIDVVTLPLIPFLYPARLLQSRQRSGVGRYATGAKGPRIPRERWSEVAARVQREGLRAVAREFEVSHETVRAIAKRVRQEVVVPEPRLRLPV